MALYLSKAQISTALAGAVLFGALGGAVLAHPERGAKQQSEQILKEDLVGEDGMEIVATLYTLPPKSMPPGPSAGWHIHPDAQETGYVLQGNFRMEIKGQDAKKLKAGEAFYLPPNVVHRGMNPGDETLKLYVVRIKPKDKPLTEFEPH